MKNNKIKKRENPGFMKNENVFVEPGHQDARDRHCVHVSRVQKKVFHFRKYILFEIIAVLYVKGLFSWKVSRSNV